MACIFDDHSTYVQSIFGLHKNENEETNLFIGKTEDEIVYPRGQKNFGLLGLDPCFKPNLSNKTNTEMEKDEKNKISYRGKMSKSLIDWLKKNKNIFE